MPKNNIAPSGKLHPLLWLILPAGSVAIFCLSPLVGYDLWWKLIHGEMGLVEMGTVVALVPAIVFGVVMFLGRSKMPRGVGLLMLLGALAAFYFAGEEISWGQQFIGFGTPECMQDVNRQGEFSLHNIEFRKYGLCLDFVDDLFNEIPRGVMLLLTIGGGIILPLVRLRLKRGFTGDPPPHRFWDWISPDCRMILVSLLAAFSTVPEKLAKAFLDLDTLAASNYLRMVFVTRAGELKEYYFALVILLYMTSVYQRFLVKQRGESARP